MWGYYGFASRYKVLPRYITPMVRGDYLIWFCIQVLGTTSGIPDLPLSDQPPPEAAWTSSLSHLSSRQCMHCISGLLHCTALQRIENTHCWRKVKQILRWTSSLLTHLSHHMQCIYKWTPLQHQALHPTYSILLWTARLLRGLMQYHRVQCSHFKCTDCHLAFCSIRAVEWTQVLQCEHCSITLLQCTIICLHLHCST